MKWMSRKTEDRLCSHLTGLVVHKMYLSCYLLLVVTLHTLLTSEDRHKSSFKLRKAALYVPEKRTPSAIA